MGLLTDDERSSLIDMLLQLPNADDEATRGSLLAGLPDGLRDGVAAQEVLGT